VLKPTFAKDPAEEEKSNTRFGIDNLKALITKLKSELLFYA